MYKIEYLLSAFDDLSKIKEWYESNFGEKVSSKVIDSILNTIDRLQLFPETGSSIPDKWLNDKGYKMVIIKRYVAIYRIIGETVFLYRDLNTKMNYPKQIN